MAEGNPALHDLVAAIGEAATLRLIEAHGGTRIYVPHGGGLRWRLAETIGREAAAALAAAYGGEEIAVPLARAWRARRYRQNGLSAPAIARRLGVTDSVVRRYLSASPADAPEPTIRSDPRQMMLFGHPIR